MAKNKTIKRAPIARRKRRTKAAAAATDGLDADAQKHAMMLYDPCSAQLAQSVYTGDQGYVNRFASYFNIATGVGETCAVCILKPANGVMYTVGTAAGTTAITLGFSTASVAGTSFLTANASKQRAVSACLAVRPVAAPNSATGTLYYGVVNAQSLALGTVTTPNQLIDLCTESVSYSQALMAPLEVKWSPGGFDDRYTVPATNSDDDSDRNVILLVGVGQVAATGINIRQICINEWIPKVGLGINNDATNTKTSTCDIACVLRNLKRKDTDWWWSLGKSAFKVGKNITNGYFSGGVVGAMGAVTKYM